MYPFPVADVATAARANAARDVVAVVVPRAERTAFVAPVTRANADRAVDGDVETVPPVRAERAVVDTVAARDTRGVRDVTVGVVALRDDTDVPDVRVVVPDVRVSRVATDGVADVRDAPTAADVRDVVWALRAVVVSTRAAAMTDVIQIIAPKSPSEIFLIPFYISWIIF